LEVQEFLRGSFLERSPIIAVSAIKGTGLEEVKQELVHEVSEVTARDSTAIARLPIDRVFTMKGFGTIVTGTLIAGTLRKEDELQLFPFGKRLRVRGVQVHGQKADTAIAGERTALNLAGLEKNELARGMVLAAPGLLHVTSRIDVKLSLLTTAKPLKSGARVHFHTFTSETIIATVNLYREKQLKPGEEDFAQLRLSAPVLLVPGDRFIIRQFSPVVTIGGGVVLDATPLHKTTAASHLDFFSSADRMDPALTLKSRVARRGEQGLTLSQATAETGWRREDILALAKGPDLKNEIIALDSVLFTNATMGQLFKAMTETVAQFQNQNPLANGMPGEALCESTGAHPEISDFVLDCLLRARRLEVSAGGLLHLPGRGVVMKDDEAESRQVIEQAFA
ncbi:MAG: hypothetical protein DMG97_01660, partial [Acidobacteria bacterium]